MSFVNGIGLNSVLSGFQLSHELSDLKDIQANAAAHNNAEGAFGLTTAGKGGLILTEMQNEENTTFLFEYRAYLNSQLTTIVTKLTNALSSDLDSVMMLQDRQFNAAMGKSARGNMQGLTTNTMMDPGAGRTAYDYLGSWRAVTTSYANPNGAITTDPWDPSTTTKSDWKIAISDGTKTQDGNDNTASGTYAVVTYGNNPIGDAFPNDTLFLDYDEANQNIYSQSGTRSFQFNVTDPDAKDGPTTAVVNNFAGNKFEEVLFRESRTAVFRSIVKAGLLQDLVVSSSTSLSTGSQLQASISLNSRNARNASPGYATNSTMDGAIDIFLTRFTAFYHT